MNLNWGRAARSMITSEMELWLGTNITGPDLRCSNPRASMVIPGRTHITPRPHAWLRYPTTTRFGSVQGLNGMLSTMARVARKVPRIQTQVQRRKEPITDGWGWYDAPWRASRKTVPSRDSSV